VDEVGIVSLAPDVLGSLRLLHGQLVFAIDPNIEAPLEEAFPTEGPRGRRIHARRPSTERSRSGDMPLLARAVPLWLGRDAGSAHAAVRLRRPLPIRDVLEQRRAAVDVLAKAHHAAHGIKDVRERYDQCEDAQ
jgi:hypothetical protein